MLSFKSRHRFENPGKKTGNRNNDTHYSPTFGQDDNEVDNLYQQLAETIDQIPKKDILIVHGDWNALVGKETWETTAML